MPRNLEKEKVELKLDDKMPHRVKEEERIERIIRDLLKLPENRRCINCNSLGPQYVCTTFWTFVCTNCSGVHREFTHRVKSASMAKFNAAEVSALQAGGNERARQIYFKVWDPQHNSCPDASNLHRIRDFIKHVYVDRKYTGENSLLPMVRTKPKCDTYEKHSFEIAGNVGGDDIYERQSFEKFSPIMTNNEKKLRNFMEQRSPRYSQENMRSGSHNRGCPSTRFEIVDDRYRDDGGVRHFDRYSSKESRARKMSSNSQRIRETNSPAIRPVKDILGEKVLPLRIGERPKANDGREVDGSARDRKAADSTNPNSENEKPKENKTVDSSSLIDFVTNPLAPTKAEPQLQQMASSTPSPAAEKVFNAPNKNSLEFLLFELSAPTALPVDSTPQVPTSADALSGAPISLAEAMDAGLTTSIPKVSNVVEPPPSTMEKDQAWPSNRTNSMGEVVDVQKLPNDQENLPSSSPKNSHSNAPLSTSVETLYDQQGNITSATNGQGPVPNAPSEEPSQASSKPTQDTGLRDVSKSTGRKELPADLFTFNHVALASAVPSWQVCAPHGMGYGMQFYPAAMSMDPSTNSARLRNPFDLGDERPQIQAAMFPAIESLHGALPNMAPLAGLQPHQSSPYASALASQVSPYGANIPRGAYTGQQSLDNPRLIRPQEIGPNFGSGEDAFASINPVQKSNGRDSSPALTFPLTGGNPFG